ncbi:MAG: DUF4870 domain-containing protein [Thermoplasmatota archaeon]
MAAAKKTSRKSAKTAPKKAAAKATPRAQPQAEPEAWATPPVAPPAPTHAWQAMPSTMRPDEERSYAMLLHLSALAGLLIGFFFIGPLILWIVKKDASPFIDRHGRAAVNFHLSLMAYAVGAIVLIGFIAIVTLGLGVLLLLPLIIVGALALGVLSIVFPIVACIRAQAGQEYAYPLSIRFIPPPGTP